MRILHLINCVAAMVLAVQLIGAMAHRIALGDWLTAGFDGIAAVVLWALARAERNAYREGI